MTPVGVFFICQNEDKCHFVNSTKLRRIFRRFVRQAPYLIYLSFYCIVGIITIWFSQNTTYNFFIRQEMW